MCFRPAGVSQSAQCPECGKEVNAVLGVFPTVCPFCGYDITEATAAEAQGGASVPGAPQVSIPGAPKAPGAPQVVKAPGM